MKIRIDRQIKSFQRGLTLVEVLVVMTLLSGFMLLLTNIFTTVLNVQTESQSTSSVGQDGRFILARLNYDMQRADAVTAPASLGASGSVLTLTIGGSSYSYAVAGGVLQLTTATVDNLNSPETTVSAFTVQRLGNVGGKDTIRLSFTLTSTTRSNHGFETKTFTTTVGRR